MASLAMFPLGTVLLPGGVLPLHVFEPRYRQMVADCLDGEREFGVTLIERGSEVGGGEVRTSVGTVAKIVELARFDDGRYAMIAVGTRRIRVIDWLDDDPYPRADVEEWPDDDTVGDGPSGSPATGPTSDLDLEVGETMARLRRVLALAAEAGDSVSPATSEVSDDPVLASYHAATLAPIGPADRYRLLAAPGPRQRLAMLDGLLDDAEQLLRFRLSPND